MNQFVFTNGIRMHCRVEGEGPLVVLCHGWPDTSHSWRHQIRALAAAGFRVAAPDQRGYGLTDAPLAVDSYDMLNLVADIVGLVHALGEDKAVVVGHDWGSWVAQHCALLRPDMFRAIATLSVPYAPRPPIRPAIQFALATQDRHFYQDYFQQPGRAEQELDRDIARSIKGLVYCASGEGWTSADRSFVLFDKSTQLVDHLVVPDVMPSWLEPGDIEAWIAAFEHSGFRGGINWYRNIDRNWALTPFLAGAVIQQPAIHIVGGRDGALEVMADQHEQLERHMPNLAGKHVVGEAGHWVHQERPVEVNQLLVPFLERCISQGAMA